MLDWSIKLFRICGIPIELHLSFLLVPLYFARNGWMDSQWNGVFWSVLTCLLVFTCVALHELGHALAARACHIHTHRILLLPFGGLAQFETMPQNPRREIAITLAGPAVNFVLALLLYPFAYDFYRLPPIPRSLPDLVTLMVLFNLIMGIFNLIPVFPMDGGRLLRAGLTIKLGFLKATRFTAYLGVLLAAGIGLWTLLVMGNLLVAALFFFIMLVSRAELKAVSAPKPAAPPFEN